MQELSIVTAVAGSGVLFWQQDGAAADWLFAVTIALVFCASILNRDLWIARWPQPLLGGFVALSGLVTLVSHSDYRAYSITVYLALLALAFSRLVASVPNLHARLAKAVVLSAAATSVLVTLGFVLYQVGVQDGLLSYGERGRGLFKDPNVAGAYMSCAFPLFVYRAARLEHRSSTYLIIGTTVLTVGVLLTLSRSALILLTAAVALGAFVLLAHRKQTLPLLLGLLIGVSISAGAGWTQYAGGRYQLVQPYDQSGRFVAWSFGLQMLRDTLMGSGSGSFEQRSTERFEASATQAPTPQPTQMPAATAGEALTVTPSAHNTYLRVAVESGAGGAALLLAYWLLVVMLLVRRGGSAREPWLLALMLALAAGLVIDTLHWRQLWLYVGIASGIVLSRNFATGDSGQHRSDVKNVQRHVSV